MQAFTIGQNQLLDEHLKWCKTVLEENEAAIEKFEKGDMRIGEGRKNLTAEWVARLKENNDALRRVIIAFEPAKFQSQVK